MNLNEQSLARDHHHTTHESIKRTFNREKCNSWKFPISKIVKKWPKTGEALLNIYQSRKKLPFLMQCGMTKVLCGDNNNKEDGFEIKKEEFSNISREQFASFLIPFFCILSVICSA